MKKNLLLSLFSVGCFYAYAQTEPTDLPYSYGFETTDLDGWTVINAGEGNNWEVSQASSQTPEPSEGENYMLYYFHDNAANSYLFSKGLNLKANREVTLKFDYMGTNVWFPEKMEVLIGNAATVEAQTTQLWIDEEIINYPYETATVNFTVPEDGVYYIAFRAFSDPDQFYLSLDNIQITEYDLGIVSQEFTSLKMYPNPVKNTLNIENTNTIQSVTVYDLSGKSLVQQKVDNKKVNLDISHLPKGMYMVRIATANGAKTMKVIKN